MADNVQNWNAVSEYNPKVILGVTVALTFLTIVIVGLRFYTRWHASLGYGNDDWTILAALVLCIAGAVINILATIGGLGSHLPLGSGGEMIHTRVLYNYEKLRYANEVVTTSNLGVVKVSILLFYRRLFIMKRFQTASMAMIVFVIAWTVIFASIMAGQCVPISVFWNNFETDYGKSCIQVETFYMGMAWSDMVLDIMVLMFPIPAVWTLNMPWRKKIAVIDVFLLGVIVLGSGIARLLSYLQVVNETKGKPTEFFYDTPWWTAGPLFWNLVENNIAIMGACLPTLTPLWKNGSSYASNGRTIQPKVSSAVLETGSSDVSSATQCYNSNEMDSIEKIAGLQAKTQVCAGRASLEETPSTGIRVHRTFSVTRSPG